MSSPCSTAITMSPARGTMPRSTTRRSPSKMPASFMDSPCARMEERGGGAADQMPIQIEFAFDVIVGRTREARRYARGIYRQGEPGGPIGEAHGSEAFRRRIEHNRNSCAALSIRNSAAACAAGFGAASASTGRDDVFRRTDFRRIIRRPRRHFRRGAYAVAPSIRSVRGVHGSQARAVRAHEDDVDAVQQTFDRSGGGAKT